MAQNIFGKIIQKAGDKALSVKSEQGGYSECCNALLHVESRDEGTSHYVCTKCGCPTEPKAATAGSTDAVHSKATEQTGLLHHNANVGGVSEKWRGEEPASPLVSGEPKMVKALKNAACAIATLPEDALGYGQNHEYRWPLRDELLKEIESALSGKYATATTPKLARQLAERLQLLYGYQVGWNDLMRAITTVLEESSLTPSPTDADTQVE